MRWKIKSVVAVSLLMHWVSGFASGAMVGWYTKLEETYFGGQPGVITVGTTDAISTRSSSNHVHAHDNIISFSLVGIPYSYPIPAFSSSTGEISDVYTLHGEPGTTVAVDINITPVSHDPITPFGDEIWTTEASIFIGGSSTPALSKAYYHEPRNTVFQRLQALTLTYPVLWTVGQEQELKFQVKGVAGHFGRGTAATRVTFGVPSGYSVSSLLVTTIPEPGTVIALAVLPPLIYMRRRRTLDATPQPR
ncbi:MAG TPA: hypothetical protein VF669_11830 [Tepidisphaeraceae bacterium]|jgi:peptidoglycan hydrolase-like protein with peptidoglycan-binding domain